MSKHNKSGVSQKGQVVFLGIDLSKKSFQLHCVDAKGNVVIKKKLNRKALLPFIANLPECAVGIEVCGGSHYWCRKFTELGHDVNIMAPQFVKPYVKSNKNDAADAEAICEAMQRPSMRFVPTKTIEQQDIQSLHRIRSQAVARRTALGSSRPKTHQAIIIRLYVRFDIS
ncbi:IS110 family transposase [Endozoicomonas sp. SCSIO W0465]|uniref:IS110 family transposase n=1 Tax=Endozoicomonas sp. SCSIO W0465 TaxID=2918516 RepID=UPI0020761FB3|nr:IS110 family transposase [Endozoicomonas sp. SCSIO W0465]USE35078.1 IS110 family transposase [Endozoicomonas sp. SCSIO W0465]